jgi:ABC-2 type transport system permease protein
MLTCSRAELFKLVRRRSSWLSIVSLAILPLLLGLVFRVTPVTAPEGVVAPRISGYAVLMMTMSTAMGLFAPLVSAFIGAELLAKEHGEGTLKLSLMRPVSRVQVLLSKCLACLVHNAALVTVLWLVALLVGALFFHYGQPDQSMSAFVSVSGPGAQSGTVSEVSMSGAMGQTEALLRLAGSYAYLVLSLTVVSLLAMLWSTVIASTAGVVVATLAAVVGMSALGGLRGLARYLFSTHLVSLALLADEVDWTALGTSIAVLAVYAAAFIGVAAVILRRRDILS